MDKELALIESEKLDPIVEQAINIWADQDDGMTVAQLATKYDLSERSVYNRIKLAKEALATELEKKQNQFLAEIWRAYQKAAKELWNQWMGIPDPVSGSVAPGLKDPAVMNQYRGVLKDMRELVKLDKAPKASVNEKGQAMPQVLVMNFKEDAYLIKEREFQEKQKKVIEGEFTVKQEESTTDNIDKKE